MSILRTTCIERAGSGIQDCLVVGAGINGAVAAAALAGNGVKVTIIDKADFASFTSQESSNLAWGGIKYLETCEFGLVWGLCKSRNHLMKSYPSQVEEIRFYTSIAKGFRKPRIILYLGALLYWFMGRCQTRAPRLLRVSNIRKEAPAVKTDGLIGGLEYSDCFFVENDTRFAFGFIRSVLRKGGNAINYMELIAAEQRNGLWHCTLRDQVSGKTIALQARTLVNAAGPFADKLNLMLGIESPFKHIFSKGAHIIVPQITTTRHVLTFFASDGRLFFMIPMGRRTCIGTTDTRVDKEVAEPGSDDVEFLLANANALLNLEKPLTKDDVISQRCGVRPLVVKKEADVGKAEWTALSRKHEIDIHPEEKMLSIYGGKLTDCINVGNEVAEIIASFGIALDPECLIQIDGREIRLDTSGRWYGEPGEEMRARFAAECEQLGVDEQQCSRLWRRYSEEAFQCLEKIRQDPSMAEPVIENILRAELHHMAENEMVVKMDDFLRRRTRLALTVGRATLSADPALDEAAHILFGSSDRPA